MRKFLLICFSLLFLICGPVLAESSKVVLDEADQLIEAKQYDSAFSLLSEKNKEANNPDLTLKQVEIALNYFAVSTMHQMFGFKDLEPGETIEEVRGKGGVYSYYKFEINKIMDELIAKEPEDWRLYKALGEFYFEVYLKYGNRWLMSPDELLALTEKNYTIAYEHGEFDYKSLYVMGYCTLQKKDYNLAEKFFLESLKLKEDHAITNYNLAYTYLQKGELDSALQYAESALKFYQDPVLKADAARMMAVVYRQKNDDAKAVEYYKTSASLDPESDYTYIGLLELSVKASDLKAAASYADMLFDLKPTAPRLTDYILTIYTEGGVKGEFLSFFDRMVEKYANENEVLGNLHFYKALYYQIENNPKEEKECLTQAKKYFKKCFKSDHYVFKVIDDRLKEL